MKITYIKSKDTETINVPELKEKVGNILNKYLDDKNELLFDSYVAGNRIEGVSEEAFLFMDEETTNNLINCYRDYNLLIEYKDITHEVKTESCDLEEFKNIFYHNKQSECNIILLNNFLKRNMTYDDVLDKISIHGYDYLNEHEKKILSNI
jgi:hypothetical protein